MHRPDVFNPMQAQTLTPDEELVATGFVSVARVPVADLSRKELNELFHAARAEAFNLRRDRVPPPSASVTCSLGLGVDVRSCVMSSI